MDQAKRSVVKTISWRITGSSATFLIAYFMTGSFAIAGVIGLAQMATNTVLYTYTSASGTRSAGDNNNLGSFWAGLGINTPI